ncbi:type IX secretion system sortase PorU [Flavobacterium sp. RHBU_24]|uniref:type IX secretion system sortase PorU n=1 Tax=Flavobacterium sp. RHBU_24 TaxID=3391185 RepID=UPI003984E802
MMKNGIISILLLFSALSLAQQGGEVVLRWDEVKEITIGDQKFSVPHFNASYMDFRAGSNELFFNMHIDAKAKANEASIRIYNTVYESLPAASLGSLNRAALPNAITPVFKSINSRGEWSAFLRLSPVIKDGSGYKRLKSFSYSWSYAQNTNRSAQAIIPPISNSVLSTSSFYKFYVEKSGVYKLTRSFLQGLGFDANVDPRSIRIYGNGGRMLPMANAADYPMDLAENAIRFIGEEDGKFDGGDYILFYAEGVDNWNAESGTNNNLFTDRAYYYVTTGTGNGKRIQPMVQPAGNPVLTLDTFDDYQFFEEDKVNIARLGRKWHGEDFTLENEQSFTFAIPDIATGSPVKIRVSAAANSVAASTMAVSANNTALGAISFAANTNQSQIFGVDGFYSGTFTASGIDNTIKLAYNNGGVPAANAWLDYIIIEAKRNLKGSGKQFRFRYRAANTLLGAIQYNFTNASGISEVWDVTDIYNATAAINDEEAASFSFKADGGMAREYVTVVPTDYMTPLREGKTRVAAQNLKGTIFKNAQGQFQDIDYVIVAPEFLTASAEKLANIHRERESMVVKVVKLEDIYQEFSSGQQDIGAIRNFMRYVYFNASTPAKRIKYLNLFGEASFDYKNRIPRNTNIVPIVHAINLSQDSLLNYSIIQTFVTDDFYGAMDEDEGAMTTSSNYGLDIAVGRMLVTTTNDAEVMVNKVVEYLSEESYGRWRNEYIMLADDPDIPTSDSVFMPTLDSISGSITANKPFVNVRKVYMDAYVQQASSGGQRYPEAKEQLLRYINYGALVVNYLGHGGPGGMATERIFESGDAPDLTNRYKYPLFITTTCDLTKFDNPYLESVGELLYKNPSGGAIAMITTTRAIYVSDALTLNRELSGYLYSYQQNNTYNYPSMAEALRRTKAAHEGGQFVNVTSFIGDPALMLAIPKINVVLTAINDIPVSQFTGTLQSLAYAKLSGRVTDESGNTLGSYNGELEASVFDKPISRTTLANDHPTENALKVPFDTLGETIFRGSATVTNGQFSFGFVVPRDIRIPVGAGRVSFYSKKNNVLEDQTGYNNTIQIGGINTSAVADNTAPIVKLFMNDETFVSGGITNDAPILLAYLEDAHGINTSSGIGHDIIGILDGDETHPYLMNDYYVADPNDYTRGKVNFPFVNLEKGLHTLQFQAWDVYNNLVTAEIQFVVAGSDELTLERVLNYPNPFVSYTEFWFNHNRPFEPLDVQVQVFTITGKIVKTINQQVTTDGFLSRDIKWDGRDDFGDKIGKGVYIYKLTVKSASSNKRAEKFEKLVLL